MTIKASMTDEEIIAELAKYKWEANVVYDENNWLGEDDDDDDDVEEEFEKSLDADITIEKTDEKKGLVFGWASVIKKNGEVIVDRQGDVIEDDWEMEKAAYNFVMSCRVGGEEHVRKGVSTLVESMAFTDEKCKALGLPDDFPRGWWTGWKITDETVMKRMKAGKYTGFSVHGRGKRKVIAKSADEMTNNDKQEALNQALKALYPSSPALNRWVYVRDFTDTWVVYSLEQGGVYNYFKADWSFDDDNNIVFGDHIEVKSKTTFVKKSDDDGYDADAIDDVLSRAKKKLGNGRTPR